MSETTKPVKNRRKNYFIERSFQTWFIIKFCFLVMASGLLTIGILYYGSLQSTTVAIINLNVVGKTTADFILPVLVQTVAVVMVLISIATIMVTMFVSHKIAGPLYRFKKAMQEVGEGNLSEINLRQMDQLKDLAQEFNRMVRKLKEKAND